MNLKFLTFFVLLAHAYGDNEKLKTDDDNYNPATRECGPDTDFLSRNNITYAYGLLADCKYFFINATDVKQWKKLEKKVAAMNPQNNRCFGNDFVADIQIRYDDVPVLFVLDKHYNVFARPILQKEKLPYFSAQPALDQSFVNYLATGEAYKKRGTEEDIYQKYRFAGGISGNVASDIAWDGGEVFVKIGVRQNPSKVDNRCLMRLKGGPYLPLYIDFLAETDWRTSVFKKYVNVSTAVDVESDIDEITPETITKDVPLDYYLREIAGLWIICLCFSIIAVIVIVLTGIFFNFVRRAKVQLEVAVEALMASSCENPEHQLKRSDLLNQCGFPSVEVNDTNIVTGVSLQEDNGTGNISEYDVIAEQIRRVQAAPIPEKSEKSGSQASTKSKSPKQK